MRCRRCSMPTSRAQRLDGCCYESRISIRLVAGRNMKQRSTKIWRGLGSSGKRQCGGSPSAGTTTILRSPGLRRWAWFIRASKPAPTLRVWWLHAKRRVLGRAIPTVRRYIPAVQRACRHGERRRRMEAGEPYALRLDMQAALPHVGSLTWIETGAGPAGETGNVNADPTAWGDFILARKETPTSYHLAVVVDDTAQGRHRRGTGPRPVSCNCRPPRASGTA